MSVKSDKPHHKAGLRDYAPLLIVIVMSIVAAFAVTSGMGMFSWKHWMANFMGLFFIQLATFKFFAMKDFAEAFAVYDIPTRYFKPYAYIYPFIELVLGLLYLAHYVPVLTNLLTVIVMLVSLVGVTQGFMKHKHAVCACLGTVIKLPIGTISLIENLAMAIMALVLLF
jgi:hypothetical protein